MSWADGRITCIRGLFVGLAVLLLGAQAWAQGAGPTAADYTTYRVYDDMRRPILVVGPDPDGAGGGLKRRAEQTTYDAEGRVTKVEVGTVSGVSIGADGKVAVAGFVALQTTDNRYDAVANKTQLYTNRGTSAAALIQTSYDAVNRAVCAKVRMTPGDFQALYDASDRPNACAAPPAGATNPDRVSKTVYDAAGQVQETIQAFGADVVRTYAKYTYTPNGQQATITDANNNTTRLEYDGLDRLSRQYFPSAVRGALTASTTDYEQYWYDANGNRISLRKRDGSNIVTCYDALNREVVRYLRSVAACDVAGQTREVFTSYDLAGRKTAVRFQSSVGPGVVYAYDTAGRLTTEATFGKALTYEYDLAGNQTRLTWPDTNFVANTIDAAGRLKAVALTTNPAFVTYGFDDLGRRTYASYFNGATTSWGFDASDRLTVLAHDLAGADKDISFGFVYNPAGQVTRRTTSNRAYAWGATNAVLSAVADGLNRDAAIAAVGGYDTNQNLVKDSGRTFAYDVENRLVSVAGPAAAALEYDPLGRLSKTTVSGAITQFLYAGDKLVAEYDGAGAVLRRYAPSYGVDEAIVWWEGAGFDDPRTLHVDRQGSVIATATSASATIHTYGPYGEPGDNWGAGSRFRYTGQIALPELRLYHYKARVYDPARGWFLQTDPIGYEDDLNLYAYVGNDPLNKSDPTGLRAIVVEDQSQRSRILPMINSQSRMQYKFDNKGNLVKDLDAKANSRGSSYLSRRLDAAIDGKATISVRIGETMSYTVRNRQGVPRTEHANVGENGQGVTDPNGSQVYITGRSNFDIKDQNGRPLSDTPAQILTHELVGHAIPRLFGGGKGSAIDDENVVRGEMGGPLRYKNPVYWDPN